MTNSSFTVVLNNIQFFAIAVLDLPHTSVEGNGNTQSFSKIKRVQAPQTFQYRYREYKNYQKHKHSLC